MSSTTIQTVDGIEVVAEEPVETPLSTPNRPVYFTRAKRLLLVNDSTVYACTECEYTADTVAKVRGHLTSRHPEGGKRGRTQGTPPPCPVDAVRPHARRARIGVRAAGVADGDR